MIYKDMLSEDPYINGQAVALISIIGPHMRQKCDVWGIKIKGTASSEEEADKMGKRLQALDPDIDIFRVPVGKFFPLSIDPASADNTIYQDERLNELIKENKLNRMQAKDHFEERKTQMVEDAIREGQTESSSSSVEHPVALLNRVNTTESRIQELQKELDTLQNTLNVTQLKFNELSVEDKTKATEEFNKINGTTVESIESNNLIEETNNTKEILESIKTIEQTLEKGKCSDSEAIEFNSQLNILKAQLSSKKTNEFINDSFKDSQYNGMF
jgi:hypothetical protein